jgi:hypothetical protein
MDIFLFAMKNFNNYGHFKDLSANIDSNIQLGLVKFFGLLLKIAKRNSKIWQEICRENKGRIKRSERPRCKIKNEN